MNTNLKNQYNDLTVYYANKLARSYYKFSLEEQKVLHLIFGQINPYGNNPTVFKLNKLEFFNKLELESQDRYNRYRRLVRALINKTFFEIKDEQGGELMGVVVYSSYWKPKEPYFEVSLNPNFMPYLEQLVKNYTKINLDSALKLKSKYSLSLYKWLCSWTNESKNQNQRYITTRDLKELLGLSVDAYTYRGNFNRADFERRTINPAINEINNKTNLMQELKKQKKGNKILNYEFIWIQKENSNLKKENPVGKSKSILSKSNLSKNEIEKVLQNIDSH
ncbi:replication initiation protein [Spiroplasma endosymbiont of Polydrusus pterygomalis]|uniref:replication initiation protein n=1 Tax=Spiroplasma endosymbiont of Polydrusus pterygomalis TaxID=3139327 RepID=UPI003CCB19B1